MEPLNVELMDHFYGKGVPVTEELLEMACKSRIPDLFQWYLTKRPLPTDVTKHIGLAAESFCSVRHRSSVVLKLDEQDPVKFLKASLVEGERSGVGAMPANNYEPLRILIQHNKKKVPEGFMEKVIEGLFEIENNRYYDNPFAEDGKEIEVNKKFFPMIAFLIEEQGLKLTPQCFDVLCFSRALPLLKEVVAKSNCPRRTSVLDEYISEYELEEEVDVRMVEYLLSLGCSYNDASAPFVRTVSHQHPKKKSGAVQPRKYMI